MGIPDRVRVTASQVVLTPRPHAERAETQFGVPCAPWNAATPASAPDLIDDIRPLRAFAGAGCGRRQAPFMPGDQLGADGLSVLDHLRADKGIEDPQIGVVPVGEP